MAPSVDDGSAGWTTPGRIPDAAVEAAAAAAYELKPVELFGREHPITWEQLSDSPLGQRCKDNELAKARAALEAAAPHMLREGSAQALEDALIDFGRESVYLTTSQETMARFLRERAAELRPQ